MIVASTIQIQNALLDIHVDGDFVDLHYQFVPENLERIRHITGYLVRTLDRFHDTNMLKLQTV